MENEDAQFESCIVHQTNPLEPQGFEGFFAALKWCLPFILSFTENLCDRIFRVLVDRGAQFLSDPDTACG